MLYYTLSWFLIACLLIALSSLQSIYKEPSESKDEEEEELYEDEELFEEGLSSSALSIYYRISPKDNYFVILLNFKSFILETENFFDFRISISSSSFISFKDTMLFVVSFFTSKKLDIKFPPFYSTSLLLLLLLLLF